MIASPFGSPVALKVSVSPSGSVATSGQRDGRIFRIGLTGERRQDRRRFTLVTVHVKVWLPVANPASVTVTVTGCVPALV